MIASGLVPKIVITLSITSIPLTLYFYYCIYKLEHLIIHFYLHIIYYHFNNYIIFPALPILFKDKAGIKITDNRLNNLYQNKINWSLNTILERKNIRNNVSLKTALLPQEIEYMIKHPLPW